MRLNAWAKTLAAAVACLSIAAPLVFPGGALLPPVSAMISDREAERDFARFVDGYLQFLWSTNPGRATDEGIHTYDGRLPDLSQQALAGESRELKRFSAELQRIDRSRLGRTSAADWLLVDNDIKAQLLEIDEIEMWRKNPDLYSSTATACLFSLIKRDFAPLPERMKAAIARERQIPALLAAGRKNVVAPPQIYTKIALEQMPGIIDFFKTSLPKAFKPVKDARLQAAFKATNEKAISELSAYQAHLRRLATLKHHTEFALGERLYVKKLALEEMVDTPVDKLLAAGEDELRHLQSEFVSVARTIDAGKPPRVVFDSLAADHPRPEELITSVAGVLEEIRRFCIERSIVTIPSEERARVEETPPFMRALSFASMDTPGPFERRAREAYYHVTLPEPGWSAQKTEEHMRSFSRLDLLNTSIHEAYPGHYVQFLWVPHLPSKVRQVIGCGTNAEGWAHYCEQMMLDQGFGGSDAGTAAKLRLVQLHDALLRVCRYIVGIRLHVKGMTVDQGIDFFMREGYQERANAERETKRGTMDPTYLMYTLGKLEILKLREDYRRLRGDQFSLKEFHDSFLKQGFPPVKIVRAYMLGEDLPQPPAVPAGGKN